ncbi:MAG: cyclic nucleotide-binding domain-containing protein [Ardenticatenaceae bacterium]|nr:cyclic nucleotide-binding domain-containing protein [Ardenticatenaceae bacterium]
MNVKFKLLHDYRLFQGLNEEQMQAVLPVCREKCFVPDTILFEEGQAAEEMLVLVDGEVEESFSVDGASLTLTRPVQVGDMIGCPSLVPPYTQNCTARSLRQIEVLAINVAGLRELFDQDPRIASMIQQNVIKALLERICKLRLAST